MIKEIENQAKEKMEKTLNVLRNELNVLKAGRANPAILEKITIDYYGTETPINQLAAISAPEPRIIAIQPYDVKSMSDIEKAIQKSDIGINPSNDGKVIRLLVPQLTEERRKDLAKQVKKYGEDAKVAIRNTRRDCVEHIKKLKKDGISEDEIKKSEENIQKVTDANIKEVDRIVEKKEKEIMEV